MILIISSTKGSNFKLAESLNEVCDQLEIDSQVISLEDFTMPLFTPGQEESSGVPEEAHRLAQAMKEAKALIFCAPEYNGGVPPIFNNAIAWISRTDELDWRSCFNQKFCVVATHSGGGGHKVLSAMRSILNHLGAIVLPRTILTTYSSPLKPDSAQDIVKQLNTYVS